MNFSLNNGPLGMLSPGTKRSKTSAGTMIFLLIFGAGFLAAAVFFGLSMKIDPSWTRVTGTVTDIRTSRDSDGATYAPIVSYTANGQAYQTSSNISSSSMPSLNSSKEVAYNPDQPSQAKIVEGGSSWIFLAVFGIIGAGAIILGPVLYIKSKRRDKTIDQLIANGIKLSGVVTDVRSSNTSNSSTYQIDVSAANSSGIVQVYTSDELRGLGGIGMIDFRTNPIPMDVYVDPSNPQNYYVDLSDVPNLTPERILELVKKSATPQTTPGYGNGQTPGQNPQ
jgi:hypothetical protein